MKPDDCKLMYGSTPESFRRRVACALRETEEKPMKRKYTAALVIAVVVLLTAAAYAAFSSQVAEFFGKYYGKDMQTWLEQGDVATVGQAFTMDGVVFTVDEVVYRNNGLYGIGTIRPQEGGNVVIIAEDHLPDEPYGYDIYGEGGKPEQAPDGTPTIADVVREKGGRLLIVRTLPERIGVDGGDLLNLPCVGYTQMPQRDGSIQFSFEASDAVAVAQGDVYTISMWASVCEMTADGQALENTRHGETWTVEIEPTPMYGQEPDAEPEPAATAEPDVSAAGKPEITVPQAYTNTGSLPVYAAVTRDFGMDLRPELFNQSGIAREDSYLITFKDEAQLSWAPEALFYEEYRGAYNANYKDPQMKESLIPLETIAHAASDLAGDVYSGWPDNGACWAGITLQKTALAGITLDEAKAKLEALLSALQVEGYTCDYALDMDVARIQTMGGQMNQMIQENEYCNPPNP